MAFSIPGPRVRLALSLLGYAVTAGVMAFIYFNYTGFGHDIRIWDRVGDQVRAGVSPYDMGYVDIEVFLYSPPWALIFAAVSWLPPGALTVILIVLEVLALRVCAGSWQRVGYLGLVPIFAFELSVGQINLLIAAAVALALRGDGRWAVLAALAKFSPALAIREVKRPLIVLAIAGLATIPVFGLWFDWADQLLAAQSIVAAPVPYPVRLAVAGAFLLLRRRWATGLAVLIAVPNPTPASYTLLAALMPAIKREVVSERQTDPNDEDRSAP